ncbi:MAG: RNA 2'-phosphotransferase [Bacteroidota bacterium]
MISEKQITNISKLLSLVLRHEPSHIGISLDEQGWTDVDFLISKIQEKGIEINFKTLEYIVESNSKKRFAFNSDSTKIRANQGHSMEVNLAFKATSPPDILFHGTASKFIESIQKEGLLKQSRLHVHLSTDENTALKVGQRHGKPIILKVKALEMMQAGQEFYLSENNVWLTDSVPLKYIIF